MNKERFKGIIIGIILTLAISSTVMVAANARTENVSVTYRGIRLVVNGNQVTPRDGAGNIVEPFIMNGTTYLPVRAVGEALGQPVDWDGDTSTVYIGQRPATPPTTGNTIPGGGGTVQVNGVTNFSFTPSVSGRYTFETSNNEGDPLLELRNAAGAQIARDDDGGSGLNSRMVVDLTAGQTYTVVARFWTDSGTGSYTLTVTQGGASTPNISTGGLDGGIWICDESHAGECDYLCVIAFFDDGSFFDGDLDTGWYTVSGSTVTLDYDDYDLVIPLTFNVQGDRLTLSNDSGGAITMDRYPLD